MTGLNGAGGSLPGCESRTGKVAKSPVLVVKRRRRGVCVRCGRVGVLGAARANGLVLCFRCQKGLYPARDRSGRECDLVMEVAGE